MHVWPQPQRGRKWDQWEPQSPHLQKNQRSATCIPSVGGSCNWGVHTRITKADLGCCGKRVGTGLKGQG